MFDPHVHRRPRNGIARPLSQVYSFQSAALRSRFTAHTAFSAVLGEISCLFSLALEFFTRFRGGRFLAPMDYQRLSPKKVDAESFRVRLPVVQNMLYNRTTLGQNLYRSEFALLQFSHGAGTAALGWCLPAQQFWTAV
jgi:hypothetical protein